MVKNRLDTGLQDGMLNYYLAQAKAADSNVEKRVDLEPFDFRDHLRAKKRSAGASAGRLNVNREP
jgi:hypothetical protein